MIMFSRFVSVENRKHWPARSHNPGKTTMPDLLIKGLTEDEMTALSRLAAAKDTHRMGYVVQLLRDHLEDRKPIVLGWLKLDRWGEVDAEDCPECGQELDRRNAYVALMSDGAVYGPVCNICATSD
jgi:hypothetical protein